MHTRNQIVRAGLGQITFAALTFIFVLAAAPAKASAQPARPYGGRVWACNTPLTEVPVICVEFKNAANEAVGFFFQWTENGKPMAANLSGRSECLTNSGQSHYCTALQRWFSGNTRIDGSGSNRWIRDSERYEGFRVNNLAYDTEYCFRFRAVDESGDQSDSWSGWACGRTFPQLESPQAPARPPLLTAMASTSGKGEVGPGTPFKVLVEWDPSPDENRVTAWYSVELKKGQEWFRQGQARYQPGVNEGVVEFPNGSREDESYLFRVCAENVAGKTCTQPARTSGRWWDAARARNPGGGVFNNPGKVVVSGRADDRPPSELESLKDKQDQLGNSAINTTNSDIQNQKAAREGAARNKADDVLYPDGRGRASGNQPVKLARRVVVPGSPPSTPLPICEAALQARARNSPAAPGLEARCRAEEAAKAQAPIDVDALAERGPAIAEQDPLAVELREQQPDDAARRGFDIGMAAAERQTEWGPGKQRILDSLPGRAEREGFKVATSFSLQRNRYAERAAVGAQIAAADETVAEVRDAEADPFYRLGFDIATAIFGDRARGAQGNTATGPGSLGIRNSLSIAAQRGFDAAVQFHLSRKY